MLYKKTTLAALSLVLLSACTKQQKVVKAPAPTLKEYDLVNSYPHNPSLSTQGLEQYNGKIYESSGSFIKSCLVQYTLGADSLTIKNCFGHFFAEGLTIDNDVLTMLTWKNNTIYQFSLPLLTITDSFAFPSELSETWGITNNSNGAFIISNGSSSLYFYDQSFNFIKKQRVMLEAEAVERINELAYHNDRIIANKQFCDSIFIINPHNGFVEEVIDINALAKTERSLNGREANGIAVLTNNNLLITGKQWHQSYELNINW